MGAISFVYRLVVRVAPLISGLPTSVQRLLDANVLKRANGIARTNTKGVKKQRPENSAERKEYVYPRFSLPNGILAALFSLPDSRDS